MKKIRQKDKTSLYLVLGVLIFCMLCAPALAAYNYNGSSLETIKEGTVKGDIYISYGNKAGFYDNNVTTYYTPHSLITNYTDVPSGDDIECAFLDVGVAGANTSRVGWVNTSISETGSSTLIPLGQYELNVTTLPDNLDEDVSCSGTGVYLIKYNCTEELKSIDSSAITATVKTWPGTPALDCRIYGAVLIVVYKGGDTYTQYWINEGNLNLHKEASVWVNGTYQSYTDFDANRTWFNGSVNSTLDNFNLTVGYFAGDVNQKDYLYFNPSQNDESPYNLSNPGWDLDEYEDDLVGIDVADGTGNTKKYFDLKTFDLSELNKRSADNYAVFWRGHDAVNATIWDPSYPNVNYETESYVTPFLAVLKVQG